jgi:hypothetical protein
MLISKRKTMNTKTIILAATIIAAASFGTAGVGFAQGMGQGGMQGGMGGGMMGQGRGGGAPMGQGMGQGMDRGMDRGMGHRMDGGMDRTESPDPDDMGSCMMHRRGMGAGHRMGGMMGRGMMGDGRMGRGMMGGSGMMDGMMHHGSGMQGGMQSWFGTRVRPVMNLSVDDVRGYLDQQVDRLGNKRLKVGEVKTADEGVITADIVTADNSLVQRLKVDRRSGDIEYLE